MKRMPTTVQMMEVTDDGWQTDDGSNHQLATIERHRSRLDRPSDIYQEGTNFNKVEVLHKNTGNTDLVDSANDKTESLWSEQEAKQNIFEQDDEGYNNLHGCIIHERKDDIDRILEMGVDSDQLDLANRYGQRALHLAVITDQPDIADKLILHGASYLVQDRGGGDTPLHIACKQGNLQMVMTLTQGLSEHIPNNTVNYQGETCVYVAAKQNHVDIVQYLVDMCGHDINCQELRAGKSMLHLAVERDNLLLLGLLLNHNLTDLTVEDYNGHGALILSRYHQESFNFIVKWNPELEHVITERFYEELSSDEECLTDA